VHRVDAPILGDHEQLKSLARAREPFDLDRVDVRTRRRREPVRALRRRAIEKPLERLSALEQACGDRGVVRRLERDEQRNDGGEELRQTGYPSELC
jgi:hypothetical protein